MELEIVDSSGIPQESILSITAGGTRRQVKLVSSARMRFPDSAVSLTSNGRLKDGNFVKVEVHARVGSGKLVLDKDKDEYALDFDGEMGLKLKMAEVREDTLENAARQKLADAKAADQYIGQNDVINLDHDRSDNSGLPYDSTAQEDLVQNFAKDYIERHQLRQFIQEMFQTVIREKPEDPYSFMQEALDHVRPPGTPGKSNGGNFRKGKYAAPAAGDGKPQVGLQEQDGQFVFSIGVPSPDAASSTIAPAAPPDAAPVPQGGNALAGKVMLRERPPAIRDMDLEDLGPPPKDPKYLVSLVDCQDQSSNGTFAWVGEYHHRPLYRLLGPEPRYLYFWDDPKDETWCGWWIAEQTGANDYIEWFKHKSKSDLPTACGAGEAGGKVQEAFLTIQTLECISMVSNKYEEMTIRAKLAEGFDKRFHQLEKTFRSQTLSSATAHVAKAFESQHRALEILREKLQEEQLLREAAEKRAREMEEAFRQLQSRVAAFIPS